MSTNFQKTVTLKKNAIAINCEVYTSAQEVVADCEKRSITNSDFHDMRTIDYDKGFQGVASYDEALDLMRHGYQPTVEKFKAGLRATRQGNGKRITFQNNVVGANPVVPLAIMGVPNCMIDTCMKPIKSKVVDVYYDITSSCSTSTDTIIKNGQKVLGAITALEQQGYRFNLYAVQTYYSDKSADMLVVRVKSSNQPLDLKRISFPLTHPSFFRVIGFDWYSKTPKGTYRCAYGRALAYDYTSEDVQRSLGKQMFGDNAIYFAGPTIESRDQKYIQEVLTK